MPRKKKVDPLPEDCLPMCSTCAFYQAELGADAGYCRRYPPIVVASEEGEYSAYPVTVPADWCGEFSRKLQG